MSLIGDSTRQVFVYKKNFTSDLDVPVENFCFRGTCGLNY